MKAVTQGLTRTPEFGLKSDMFKISKHGLNDGEMAACFLKLKELVPSVPQNKKISKTQLLQHVIDYIYDLELSLDFQPMVFSTTPREPLSEKAEQNSNVLAEIEAMASDCSDDCERPPSK